jgi:hypothetical protein
MLSLPPQNEAQRKFPLLKMLLQGEFTLLGATYKADYVQNAVTTMPELQQMYDTFVQHEGKPRATITEGPLKHVLGLASDSLPHDQPEPETKARAKVRNSAVSILPKTAELHRAAV